MGNTMEFLVTESSELHYALRKTRITHALRKTRTRPLCAGARRNLCTVQPKWQPIQHHGGTSSFEAKPAKPDSNSLKRTRLVRTASLWPMSHEQMVRATYFALSRSSN